MAETPTMLKRSLNEAIEGADCIIILTEQDQLKRLNLKNLRALMRTPAAIVDLVGMLEPQKVEKEGFIYRGLGRGIEKK
jgi:UDPglucose 6-dehydrogenase